MIQIYLDLARTHAALLVVSLPFFGAAVAVVVAQPRVSWIIASLVGIAAAALAIDLCMRTLTPSGAVAVREGLAIAADPLSAISLVLIAVATAAVVMCTRAFGGAAEPIGVAFSPALVLAIGGAWSGAVLAQDFTTLFVFAETAWLASVGLVALSSHKSRGALNGALRMVTLGGVAAAFFLLGIALAERGLGTATLGDIAGQRIAAPNMASVGLALVMLAVACMAGIAPLNAWTAATYGKGSTFAMLAVAAIGVCGAMLALAHLSAAVLPAPALGGRLGLALSVLGVSSAIIGSLQAIGAANIWRLVGYSAAAQLGCIVLAIALGSPAGLEAAFVQTLALAASSIALIGAAALGGVDDSMSSLDGLGRRAPLASVVMTAGALSLMGAPLTLSFLGRWRLVEAALGIGWWWVAAAAIVLSLAGSYYGGRIIERIYFRHATQTTSGAKEELRWKFALAPALAAAFITILSAIEPSLLLRAASAASQVILERAP